VTAGSYPHTHDGNSVTIREVRNVTVDLFLPQIIREQGHILLWQQLFGEAAVCSPLETFTPWHTSMKASEENPAELQVDEARLYSVERIKAARSLGEDHMKIEAAVGELWQGQDMLEKMVGLAIPLLRAELQGLIKLFRHLDTD